MANIQSQINVTTYLVEKFESAFRSIVKKYKDYRLYSTTISELRALSTRELSDLGLSRSSIKTVAFSAVYESYDHR